MLEKLLYHIPGFLQVYLVHNPVDVRKALRVNGGKVVFENEEKCGKTASITLSFGSIGMRKEERIKMETGEAGA